MILVTGVTESIGRGVVRELMPLGEKIRLLVHDRGTATSLATPGVELVQGELTNHRHLEAALRGVQRVLLLTPVQRGLVELERNVIAAALAAEVKHLVKVSAPFVGPRWEMTEARWQGEAEAQLLASCLPYTILRPAVPMQGFLRFAHGIRAQGAFHASAGTARFALVDLRDVAAVAARVLTEDSHMGCTYVLTGPEALTFHEAAEHLSSALGRHVHYVDLSPVEHRERLLADGVPAWQADDLNRLCALAGAGHAAERTGEVKALLGRAPRPFSQFAREHAVMFKR